MALSVNREWLVYFTGCPSATGPSVVLRGRGGTEACSSDAWHMQLCRVSEELPANTQQPADGSRPSKRAISDEHIAQKRSVCVEE